MTTIGFERWHNRAFKVIDRAAFVELMLRDVPPRPPAAEAVRRANQGLEPGANIPESIIVGA